MDRNDSPAEPRANILLVDDQPANLLALEAILGDLGQHLVKAPSGDDALRHLLAADFAVVLLDVRMPGLNGFEAARLIRGRKRSRHTPIIFLTAAEGADFPVIEAYKLGATDYLVKPLVPEILRAKVAGFVELFQKAEQVKRQAEQLRQSEERYRLLVESVRDYAIFLLDPEGRIVTWNAGAERIKGYAAAEIVGRHFSAFYPPEDVARGKTQRALQSAAAEGRFEDEGWRVRKDGTRFWADVVLTSLRDPEGRLRGFAKVTRDLTERKRGEEQARQLARAEAVREEAEAASRRKDEFLAMLAHELRNPLAPLLTSLQILRQAGAEATVRGQFVDQMDRQVRHLGRLVEDLLDASRFAHGKVSLRTERLDLARLARTTAEDRRALLERAGLTLAVQTPETPVWVLGDAMRLAQALDNLLDNAAKFSDTGGGVAVRVAADLERGQAALTVADAGLGIEPEMLLRLFQPFAQADRSLDRARGGLGLGLAVVKGLVELHGGTVEARSAGPGQGATFEVRLPLEPEPAALTDVPERPAASGGRSKVLVIEDNKDAADSLRLLLELLGHEARVAYTGPDGVAAAAWLPDVVISDIGLPGCDGYEVARRLRRTPGLEGALLVALTGYGGEEEKRLSRAAGFDHHLVKPADPGDIQRVLMARVA